MRRRANVFAGLSVLSTIGLLAACANVLGIEDRFFVVENNDDAGVASTDASVDQESAAADADGQTNELCPPTMILAGTFCIDATEVSQREYAKFLEATNGDAGNQIAECAANTSFAPGSGCTPFSFSNASDNPMACIDWCDAHAYCAWAGKRLCGLTDGGSVPSDMNLYNTTSDQWFSACSRQADGFHKYPYGGNEYKPDACNTKEFDAGAPVPVGSVKTCVGGYPGLYDMSGNVWEWEDSCRVAANDAGFWCVVRGGSYGNSSFFAEQTVSCSGRYDFNNRLQTNPDTGFRCCSR